METLRQLLKEAKVNIPDLEAEVRALGYDPVQLTDDDVLKIADLLKSKHGCKITKNVKNSQPANPTQTEKATEKAAKTNASIVATYQNLSNKVVERDAAKIVTIIENIPNATMSRVRELLGDSEGNLDFFLNPVEDVESNFLSKFGIE